MPFDHIEAETDCAECGGIFANHTYVPGSISVYRCPRKRTETSYGYYRGGDPRRFFPDPEGATDEEEEAYRLACELWEKAESKGQKPAVSDDKSGWICRPGGGENGGENGAVFVLKPAFGVGVSVEEFETFFRARDYNERGQPETTDPWDELVEYEDEFEEI